MKKEKCGFDMSKFWKIIGIIAGIAAAAAAIYVVVQKIKAKNEPQGYDEDNYVSCSCLDEDFVSETVAE